MSEDQPQKNEAALDIEAPKSSQKKDLRAKKRKICKKQLEKENTKSVTQVDNIFS